MKKTISINIASTIFYIEEDAYAQLDGYLQSIKQHFASYPDHEEIISDMEARIAEQFIGSKPKAKDIIITQTDVAHLIEVMGRVEDFAAESSTDSAPQPDAKNSQTTRRLYRDSDNAMIGGVSAGLGAYFGLDPVLFRLLFVLLVFGGGSGFLIYIALWLIMPEAKTMSEKSQMRGEPVNLSEMEQSIKQKVKDADVPGKAKSLFNILASALKVIIKIISKIIGVIVAFALAVAIFSVTFTYAVALFNKNSANLDFPLAQILHGFEYYGVITLSFLIAIIPLVALFMIGLSIVRSKNMFNKASGITLVSVWLLLVMAGGVVAANRVPQYVESINNLEQREQVERTFELTDFNQLEVKNGIKIEYIQTEDYLVRAVGPQSQINDLHAVVENNTLTLRTDSYARFCLFCWARSRVTVYVSSPDLERVDGSGAIEFKSTGITAETFTFNLSGASDVEVDITAKDLTIKARGASQLDLQGNADNLNMELSGASEFNGKDLLVINAEIETSGASDVEINASSTLKVDGSGASHIKYYGSPQTDFNLSGASSTSNPKE